MPDNRMGKPIEEQGGPAGAARPVSMGTKPAADSLTGDPPRRQPWLIRRPLHLHLP